MPELLSQQEPPEEQSLGIASTKVSEFFSISGTSSKKALFAAVLLPEKTRTCKEPK
jgi:hypothetical protein